MNRAVKDGAAAAVLVRLGSVLDDLLDLPLDAVSDDDVLAIWQRIETGNRQLTAVDHRLINQAQTRQLAFAHGASSVITLARQVLRIGKLEAQARVRAAEFAGPRTGLTGEVLPAMYGCVAEAQRSGAISAVHARMIVSTIEQLPDEVQATDGAAAEVLLTEQALIFDPDTFAKLTQRLALTLNQDGSEPYERQQRRRGARLVERRDGTGRLDGELTAELTAHLKVAFESLGKSVPEHDGVRDLRCAAQRHHDALLELVMIAERTKSLPDTGGVTATLVLTCDIDDWRNATGTARTGHGQVIPTREAKRWISGDTRVIGVAIDRMKAVEAYGECQRFFTENQRLAMSVRDGGCVFPGCDVAPLRCESHHIVEHAAGGKTVITNGCLLCRFHHRMFQQMGWEIVLVGGIPHLIPPATLDPERQPRRNTTHDPAAELLPV